eukprot:TRINITY_DN5579_c0_g5_i1.p1 TRINITY_DN5579_c0_g5~~TRINITY_DN5579_c0_g5_i1.p1  ORF type:complete len:104 (+),score=12.81 TRINITY_DN5579_c0_g5_i1:244-555(+)
MGFGCTNDTAQTVQCYQRGGNHLGAVFRLGCNLHSGAGVARDLVRAVPLYRQAAEQGHVWVQYSLGEMYDIGEGVPQNFQQAAKQGNVLATKWCARNSIIVIK